MSYMRYENRHDYPRFPAKMSHGKPHVKDSAKGQLARCMLWLIIKCKKILAHSGTQTHDP